MKLQEYVKMIRGKKCNSEIRTIKPIYSIPNTIDIPENRVYCLLGCTWVHYCKMNKCKYRNSCKIA